MYLMSLAYSLTVTSALPLFAPTPILLQTPRDLFLTASLGPITSILCVDGIRQTW